MDITFNDIMETERNNKDTYAELVKWGSRGIIPVLGAGCSCSVGLPDWKTLLHKMAMIDETCSERVDNLICEKKYEEAAEFTAGFLGKVVFKKRLCKLLDSSNYVDNYPYYLQLIAKTFLGPIITLNVDRVLEDFFAKYTDSSLLTFIPFNTFQDNAISDAIHHNNHILIKIHGSIDIPDSMIFSKSDYDIVYGNTHVDRTLPMPHIFEQAVSKNPLLFLGCSLNHDRFMDIMNEISFGENYALLEIPETKDELAKRRKELGDLHIFPIWYPRGTDKTQVVNVFIENLCDDLKKPSLNFTNASVFTLDQYFLDHALRYFDKDKVSSTDVRDAYDCIVHYNQELNQLKIYDTLYFGHYFLCSSDYGDDNNVRMPIEWVVLKKEKNKLLVVSKNCLWWDFYDDSSSYFFGGTLYSSPWESSTSRSDLAERFPKLFNKYEQLLIEQSKLISYDVSGIATETEDYLFFLSPNDIPSEFDTRALLYFAERDSSHEYIDMFPESCCWWLRDFGRKDGYNSVKIEDFDVAEKYRNCIQPIYDRCGELDILDSGSDEVGFRPAMWLNTDVMGRFKNTLEELKSRIDHRGEMIITDVSDGHLPFEI